MAAITLTRQSEESMNDDYMLDCLSHRTTDEEIINFGLYIFKQVQRERGDQEDNIEMTIECVDESAWVHSVDTHQHQRRLQALRKILEN